MTASIQNSYSAYEMVKKGLAWFWQRNDLPAEKRVEHIETLVDSMEKCLDSQAAQIGVYEAACGTGRALIVERPDGTDEVVSGLAAKALHIAFSDRETVIYGKPADLGIVAEALRAAGIKATGPANIPDIARQRAQEATHGNPD